MEKRLLLGLAAVALIYALALGIVALIAWSIR